MNNYNNNDVTVVHSNDLIEASYALSIDEMRLLNLALSKIDSKSENPGVLSLCPQEFCNMYNLNRSNLWRNMRLSVDNIMSKPIRIPFFDSKERLKYRKIHWFSLAEHYAQESDGSTIDIKFSQEISPYLFNLRKNFTSANFESCSQLTTPFSFRLYQWLIKSKNFNRCKEGETICVDLEIDWMKKTAGIAGNYERWERFKSTLLEPAVEQINSKTDISVVYKAKKKGRATHSVQFNYVLESDSTLAKPQRPRLKRRPRVLENSHAESEWMKTNLRLLLAYEIALKNYDSSLKLDIKDLQRVADYSVFCDSKTHERAKAELELRRKKSK